MAISYSPAYKEQALVKALACGNHSIESIANELQMNRWTLKNWLDQEGRKTISALRTGVLRAPLGSDCCPFLNANAATDLLPRKKGLFAYHLTSRGAHFCSVDKAVLEHTHIRQLKEQNRLLNQSLLRKEKALAKAAAMLILQKKFQALWGGRGKMTSTVERQRIIALVGQAISAGGRQAKAC